VTQHGDDPTVLDPDPLWRRIHPVHFVDDGQGGKRLSSAAFDNSSDGTGMSVSLGREAEAAGVAPETALQRFPRFGMASITAGTCRTHNQAIQRDPTEDDRHHALVNGDKPKRVQKKMAGAATILVSPSTAP
jgi:hypothetical protein